MPALPATEEAIKQAAHALAEGEIVAFATETVYGLGANALDARAVAKVFAAKERPRFNPLIVHVRDLTTAEEYAEFDETARRLADAFWPGPFSLVLPKRRGSDIADLVTAGLDTIALRVPGDRTAQALLAEAKLPIAAPSANRSGRVSPTTARHVEVELGTVPAFILDGGRCALGIESTVVRVVDGVVAVLRLGSLPRGEIEEVLDHALTLTDDAAIASPGQLASHYAPITPLRLDANEATPDEALLAFGGDVPSGALLTLTLSAAGDLREAAANLFASLRELDEAGASAIAVMPIPDHGLGEAINDRLRRAAKAR